MGAKAMRTLSGEDPIRLSMLGHAPCGSTAPCRSALARELTKPAMANEINIRDRATVYVVHRDTLRDSTPSLKRGATDTTL